MIGVKLAVVGAWTIAGGTVFDDWTITGGVCDMDLSTLTSVDVPTLFDMLVKAEGWPTLHCQPAGIFGSAEYRGEDVYAPSVDVLQVRVGEKYADQDVWARVPLGPASIAVTVDKDDCAVTADEVKVMISKRGDEPLDGKVPDQPNGVAAVRTTKVSKGKFVMDIVEAETFVLDRNDTITVTLKDSLCEMSAPVTISYWNQPLKSAALSSVAGGCALALLAATAF